MTEEELVATSAMMTRAFDLARRAARSDVSVLMTGESSTGKRALARWIHDHSARHDAPFVYAGCAALAGSIRALVEEARGGTLFLDEIAKLSSEAQAKLLEVLESRRSTPSTAPEVRMISATSRDIDVAVRLGRFRADLQLRLDVVRIDVPPLPVREGVRSPTSADATSLAQAVDRKLPLEHVELAYIRLVIASVGGNMVHAARILGIDRRTLYRKLGNRL